ncbi:DNA repair protein XRCC1 [Rhipicephalus sanguineus]|uniref:DNA repair protein XRCC1 n=1 Tax=Rhipicephalus sanguineus TaxID=34632 RepID=UPI0020C4432B|nr:DNA repair protein XRCC1 [Rhipicephalus sanguineus]
MIHFVVMRGFLKFEFRVHRYKLGNYHRPSTPEKDEDDDEEDVVEEEERGRGATASASAPSPRRRRESGGGGGGQAASVKRPAPQAGGDTPGGKARRVQQDDKRGSSAVVPRRQSEKEEGDSDFDADTDVDANDEDYDTEEEIQKVMQRQQKQETEASKHVGSDADPFVGDASGLDDASAIPLDLPDLPAFFTGKTFLLYGDFPADERRALTRYIVGHDGDLKEDLDDTVKFVITKSEWNDNFDEICRQAEREVAIV